MLCTRRYSRTRWLAVETFRALVVDKAGDGVSLNLEQWTPDRLMAGDFTAAKSVEALESVGLKPGTGPVIVTGASGGVGSTAFDILAARGYEVVASTGSADAHDYLRSLGASEIIDRAETSAESLRPLE